MDVLSDILDTVALRGQLYFRTDFAGDWAVAVPKLSGAARFHMLAQGSCIITVGGDSYALVPGELVLIPGGAAHILSNRPGADAAPLERVLELSGFKGDGLLTWNVGAASGSTQLVCGHFTFAEWATHPVIEALPKVVHVRLDARRANPALDAVLTLIERQVATDAPGASASVRRLSEIMFIETVRTGADSHERLRAAVGALSDRNIARALAAIHRDPGRAWTVDSLAAEAALSRSRFSDRFQELTGKGPIAYLTEWRLQRARALVASSGKRISEIARDSGYDSPAAFSRAYARAFGTSPRRHRRQLIVGQP